MLERNNSLLGGNLTFDVFEKIINDVMNKKPILFELERDTIASDDAIKQVEKRLHFTLPQNYKRFVKKVWRRIFRLYHSIIMRFTK